MRIALPIRPTSEMPTRIRRRHFMFHKLQQVVAYHVYHQYRVGNSPT